jgi:hypothetical protein
VCLGELTSNQPIREHAWRNQDDRRDRAEFEQWLNGDFQIDGLNEADAEPADTSGEQVGSDDASVSEERPEGEPTLDASASGDATAPVDGTESERSSPVESQAEHAATSEEPTGTEQGNLSRPAFSPGLRVDYRPTNGGQRSQFDSSRSEGGAHEVSRPVGRAGPSASMRRGQARGKPPVLIIEGPGPVIHRGRRARSVIVPGEQITIGRTTTADEFVDINLAEYRRYDRLLARHHARIFFDRGLWFLEDLADNDATFVQGLNRPINRETVPLRDGDRMQFGDSVRMRFHQRR